ncbi:signal peptidase II [Candidatus Peregrinibacteria bacterium]|nr:signal peptidase II [Candidatus Peregrinibacteria bacterium]
MRLLWVTAGGIALVTFLFSVAVEFIGFPVVYNRGVAFGVRLPEPFQTIAILAALTIVIYLGLHTRNRWEAFGFGSIIGGACANSIDRLIDGVVTDMFRVGIFPVFNAADAAITVGVILVLWVSGREGLKNLFTK